MSQIGINTTEPTSYFTKYALFALIAFFSFFQIRGQEHKSTLLLAEISSLTKQKGFSKKDTVYLKLLNDLAGSHRYYNSDSLLSLSKQAIAYSKTAEYPEGEIMGLMNLGNYFSDSGSSKDGILNYNKALDLSKSIESEKYILIAQRLLAGEYAYKGDYANALNGYLEAIERAEKLEDYKMLSIVNEEIAGLYVSQKDYEQALEYYKKVKKFNEKIGDEVLYAESASNMASLYADMGELDYAMFNANSSITIFEKHRLTDWLAYAYEVKGKTYLKQKKYKWAMFWYNQSELLHENLEDERGEIDLLNGIAEANLGLENDSLAQQYALKALEFSDKIKVKEGKRKAVKTLYKISKNRDDYKSSLAYHEIYQQLSDTLSLIENQKSLTLLKTNLQHDEQKNALISDNEKQLAKQRNYVNAALAILLLFIAVTFLVKRNEKLQKRLNEELKTKTEGLIEQEKELKEINETKDKLFSIVAHDLRGPIGAFQGLLNLYKQGEIEKDEFIDFIPKLGNDIDHISFTLNNLLSWGQNQMNGLVTKPEIVSLDKLVASNINLHSETALNKSIKLASSLPRKTLAWTDGDQIDIVIRNLISNAIKFTPVNGMVTVTSREKNDHWEISIKDTGIGMERETLNDIFSDKNNHSTYGTNNEKGTGLGLSLCKEMVEKNNGAIWADSIVNQGTTFYFTVPKAKYEKKYKKTA
ncbi:tetratricopeptide repeat-containing sensor histidine kinase [Maribacter sp.]|nr:tetratricopeptide repeat-containing sensor histidine kinase [Maribacter sp.]